jgi:hypothetical protein
VVVGVVHGPPCVDLGGLDDPGGPTLRDGDIFRIDPAGLVVAYPESLFTAATGTVDVDIDAFATAPDGTLWSFADDETTTSATLTATLGGNVINRHVASQTRSGRRRSLRRPRCRPP